MVRRGGFGEGDGDGDGESAGEGVGEGITGWSEDETEGEG